MNGVKIVLNLIIFAAAAIGLAVFWFALDKPLFYTEYAAQVAPAEPSADRNNVAPLENGSSTLDNIETAGIREAALPEVLTPAKKIVSAPAVKLPELTPDQTAGNGALTRAGIIYETNRRRQINLGAGFDLRENSYLDIAATGKVKDMFDNQYFEHVSPAKLDAAYFAARANYEYIAIGENLARGNYENDAAVVRAWMDSPGHRENILKSGYKEIGVAAAYGMFEGKNTWLAVQIFAVSESACPKVDAALAAQIESAKSSLDGSSARLDALAAQIDREKNQAKIIENELNSMIARLAPDSKIESKQNQLVQAAAAVNVDVNDYNSQIKQIKTLYASYKEKIDSYNSQVTAYNTCLAALE